MTLIAFHEQRLGGCEKVDPEDALVAAEKLAAESDAVIIVAGLTPDWEAEGFDRPTLDLPGKQNELIARVGKANPNTVVCIQAVSLPHSTHAEVRVLTCFLGLCGSDAVGERRERHHPGVVLWQRSWERARGRHLRYYKPKRAAPAHTPGTRAGHPVIPKLQERERQDPLPRRSVRRVQGLPV